MRKHKSTFTISLPKPLCFAEALLLVIFFSCSKQDVRPVDPAPPPPPKDTVTAITSVLKGVTTAVNAKINGYYVALPSNYEQTNTNYPLLLFIPGAGQFGNGAVDLPLLLNDGPAQLVDEKRFPGTFGVGGKAFSLIVFTPQSETFPGSGDVSDCIAYVKSKYRIDTTRIYLSGLSSGSIAICNWAADNPQKIAALVPMAGTPSDFDSSNRYQSIAAANLPVWAFHSADDPTIKLSNTQGFIAKIASYQPSVLPRLTIWNNGGHDAWTRALNPDYKEQNLNIYEWMLQYHR